MMCSFSIDLDTGSESVSLVKDSRLQGKQLWASAGIPSQDGLQFRNSRFVVLDHVREGVDLFRGGRSSLSGSSRSAAVL